MSDSLTIKEGRTEYGVTTIDGEKAIVSSRDVADVFGKRHADVLRSIDKLIKRTSEKFARNNFKENSYKGSSGKLNREYLLSPNGLKYLIDNFRSDTLTKEGLKWAKNIYNPNLKIIENRREINFKYMLETILNDMEIIHQMPILDYRIDFFIPYATLIVEYDEKHHKYNVKEDKIRINEIREEIMRRIICGEKLYENDIGEPNPHLKGKDITNVVRVKEGKELEGLREILITIHESGSSPTDFMISKKG
ncbi:MAG: Rha family transcriptional regulator [Nanoarchaeota archaeon]